MALRRGFSSPADFSGGVVAIGNFDGVHRGHQKMLSVLVERARSLDGPAVVMTFDPHPIEILRPELAPPALCTLPRKAELLSQHGVDFTLAVPVDRELLALSPEQFFSEIIQGKLQAHGLVEGPNFRFGKDRAGDVEMLAWLCGQSGMSCEIVNLVELDGLQISSSLIREFISQGEVAKAGELLGHPHRASGIVQKGAGRGKEVGFPTANLTDIQTLLPLEGVYAGLAWVDGNQLKAAINLGPNPTFGETERKFEVHLLDFTGDLYGRELEVDFLARLRGIQPFADSDALKLQIAEDIQAVRAVANAGPTH